MIYFRKIYIHSEMFFLTLSLKDLLTSVKTSSTSQLNVFMNTDHLINHSPFTLSTKEIGATCLIINKVININ